MTLRLHAGRPRQDMMCDWQAAGGLGSRTRQARLFPRAEGPEREDARWGIVRNLR